MPAVRSKSLLVWLVLSGLLTLSLTACPKKQYVKKTPEQTEEEKAEADKDVESQELDVHGKDFVPSESLAAIHFDYDSSGLSNEARDLLNANAGYLKKNKDLEVRVDGYCDNRGTVAYNLALGQRRAAVVRKYYVSLGLEPKRIGTISFGRENPLCGEDTEACWQKNRRAETLVRALKLGQSQPAPEKE